MKLLKLPQTTLYVRRTGLPFYDAARVIGVAQLFFGTSSANVCENGFGWTLIGMMDGKAKEDVQVKAAAHRLWNSERLRGFERKPNNYGRMEKWGEEKLREKWGALCQHFTAPFGTQKSVTENTTGLMDSALALGARGISPTGYGDFAAESGTASQQPEAEILVALIGLSHAARVTNAMFVLPIFGEINAPFGRPYAVTTAAYWNYKPRFNHEAGESISAIWAMLALLDALLDANLPVKDFAYNRADRPIYHSGTLGAERMCRKWQEGCENLLREIARFLQATQREKGRMLDLARVLAEFALNPDVDGFERIVRLKSRAMADEDNRAKSLLRQNTSLKEIDIMLDEKLSKDVPPLPDAFCQAVRQALSPSKDNKGWISGYMKLENASTPHRFIEEAQRLVSRARMDKSIYYPANVDKPLTEYVNQLASSPQRFRAFRAAFLLKVLQIPTKAGLEDVTALLAPAEDAQTAAETPDAAADEDNNEETNNQ